MQAMAKYRGLATEHKRIQRDYDSLQLIVRYTTETAAVLMCVHRSCSPLRPGCSPRDDEKRRADEEANRDEAAAAVPLSQVRRELRDAKRDSTLLLQQLASRDEQIRELEIRLAEGQQVRAFPLSNSATRHQGCCS